jgi:hypothetical protein
VKRIGEDPAFDGACPTCGQLYLGDELESLRASNARLAEQCTAYAAEVHKLRAQLKRCVEPAWVGTNPQFNSNNGF